MASDHDASDNQQAGFRDIDSVIDLLASDDVVVREQAITWLLQIREPAIPFLIHALHDSDRWHAAVETLVRIGQPAVEPLIGVLYDAPINTFAFEALTRIGEPAVPALLNVLHHPQREARFWVVEALGEIGDTRAIAPLKLVALHDPNEEIQRNATRALAHMGVLPSLRTE